MVLLRGNDRRAERVSLRLLIKVRERRHEFRRFKNYLPIAFQRSAVRTRSIAKLRVRYRMRWLPDQQRTNGRWAVRAFGANHLGPSRSGVALRPGQVTRRGQNSFIPSQALLQQRRPVPQRELRRMPPVHLKMKLAVPTVDRQPGLLRRR